MHTIIRLKALTILTLSLMGLGSLASASPAARALPPPPKDCPPTLAYKSCLGLMPPAYGADPDAPSPQSVSGAPDVPFLNAAASTPTGSWPQVLAAANITSSSRADAAVATERYFDTPNDRQLHLFNMPAGTFTRAQQLAAGASPEAAVTIDANLDGRPDVVTALAGDNTLAVFGSGGTQPLSDAVRLRAYGAPDALAAGDFDGDLRPDLAAAAPLSNTIRLWRSSAAGLAPLPHGLPFATQGYDALGVGDLNNDGQDDIVALRGAGYPTDSVAVYPQAHGTFPMSDTISPEVAGYLPQSLAVGDVNGDGRDDIVVTAGGNVPDTRLNVFLQDANGIIATTPITYPALDLPSAVAIADINHDGLEDVVVVHDGWRTLSVYTQNSGHTLDDYTAADIPYSSRYRPNALALADFDGNGGLDVALVGKEAGLTVLTNKLSAPTATIMHPLEAALLPPGTVTISGTASASATRVQVRIRGLNDWANATLTGANWHIDLSLPPQDRAWTIEVRAVDAQDHYQAPPARRRVRVESFAYAVADNGNLTSSPDRLMIVGANTARATLVGDTGTEEIEAIAFQPNTPTLFAADAGQLGTLDLHTGAFTARPQRFGRGNGARGRVTFSDVDGLAFVNSTTLYGVQRRSGKDLLFQVDPATGAYVPNAFGSNVDYVEMKGNGVLDDVDDIAFDPTTNRLYGASNNSGSGGVLIVINTPATSPGLAPGAASVVGAFGVDDIEGLACTSDGRLYGTTGDGGGSTKNKLYTIDKTSGHATVVGPFSRERDYEAIAFPPPGAPLPNVSQAVPHIDSFTIDGDVASTADRDVTLHADASSMDSGDTRWLLFVEYAYDQASGQWVAQPHPVQASDWRAYAGPEASYPWRLSSPAGVRYVQAWAADGAGKIAPFAYQASVNYAPGTDALAQGEVRVFRYTVRAGQRLTARLESSGDADLYVWPQDPDSPPWFSNISGGTDSVTVDAADDSVYQVEVRGFTAAEYHLAIDITESSGPPSPAGGVGQGKPQPSQPAIPVGDTPGLGQAPLTGPVVWRTLYLPLVRQ